MSDQNSYFTENDRFCLHKLLSAFFLSSRKEKTMEILNRSNLAIVNLERDIEQISIFGNNENVSDEIKAEVLVLSKFQANNFSAIIVDIQT